MIKHYNVLIIEDHPIVIEVYKNAFLQISSKISNVKFNIDTANNCDSAYLKIKEAEKKESIDIIFLDIKLPPSKDGEIVSGEDLGVKTRRLLPNTKIVVVTTFNDNYRINNIFKNINPDGFLIKNDLNPEELILAIEAIINNTPHYSETVIQLMRNQTPNNFLFMC